MASELQVETARRNGARSRGPKTAAGKLNSSRNSLTHGLFSRSIVIEGEDPARFAALLHEIRTDLQPQNSIENGLVEDLACFRWRQRRMLAMETASMSDEIRSIESPGDGQALEDPIQRAVTALAKLTARCQTLETLHRMELRFNRQYNRTLQRFLATREQRKGAAIPGKIVFPERTRQDIENTTEELSNEPDYDAL